MVRGVKWRLLFFYPLVALFMFIKIGAAVGAEGLPAKSMDIAELLIQAYPEAKIGKVADEDGISILLHGRKLLVSPRGDCPAAFPGQAHDAPLCAMFQQRYPIGEEGRHPERGYDPGRIRHEEFLTLLYGGNAEEVAGALVTVDFLGEKVLFSSRNGAAGALARVALSLKKILSENPQAKEWVLPTAGTFAWRTIKKSPRLSAHSFAIAIDLNKEKGLYWLWGPSPLEVEKTRKKYPQAVVDAFEAEGFIWGGKWHSFDFMHFEYRPELILHAPVQGRKVGKKQMN